MTRVLVASAAQHEAVLDLVDNEFFVSRGRTGSVRRSFPGLLDGYGEAVIAENNAHEPVSAACWRPFGWWDGERHWRAAMVGLVVTRADGRGAGLGSAVMCRVRERLLECGIEVGVLWARRQAFYVRLGWQSADPGVRGAVASRTGVRGAGAGAREITPQLARDLLAVHRAHVFERVERSPDAYRAVPAQAERVVAYVTDEGAYALVGRRGKDAFLLETVGAQSAFPSLWAAVSADATNILVNERCGSPMQCWLAEEHGVRFDRQGLALWLPLADNAAKRASFAAWHVGWLDRM